MNIPKDVILIHLGSNASIPTGWVRETGLDGKFPKGSGDSVAPNETGGAATHTHTSDAHSHTLTAHTHTYKLSESSATSQGSDNGSNSAWDYHTHSGTSGELSGGTTSSDSLTYGAMSNNPPNRKVIFIKANAGAKLATDIAALWIESDTAPTNWAKVTELADRYLLGASTGADADLTTDGGSVTNVHGITHGHTGQTHTHAAANSGNHEGTGGQGSSETGRVAFSHVHSVTLNASTQNVADNTSSLTTTETVEPAYQRLHLIKKAASGLKEKGIIGLWLGSVATIPAGWILVAEMKDKHCKIGNPVSSGTGGSNTHTHAAQGHVHTGNGTHTHTGPSPAHVAAGYINGYSAGSRHVMTNPASTHPVTNVSTPTTGYDSVNTTANSSNNEPEYKTVAFIKFQTEMGGGPLLLSLMR